MVLFGQFTLPHVLDIQTTKTRMITDRDIPYAPVAYRADDRDLAQTITVKGEIRETEIDAAYLAIEKIRRLNDGTALSLDLQDGTTPIVNSKLVDPAFSFAAGDWFPSRYRVPYSITFLETQA
jgi:hypothetical protein